MNQDTSQSIQNAAKSEFDQRIEKFKKEYLNMTIGGIWELDWLIGYVVDKVYHSYSTEGKELNGNQLEYYVSQYIYKQIGDITKYVNNRVLPTS